MREQHALVAGETFAQVVPVERPAGAQNQVQHVAPSNRSRSITKDLLQTEFLGRREPDVVTEHARGHAAREPQVIDRRDGVAAAEDDVHLRRPGERLAEPVRERQARVDAGARNARATAGQWSRRTIKSRSFVGRSIWV